MTSASQQDRERLLALLSDQALEGLGSDDATDLAGLLRLVPDVEPTIMERAAAELHAAVIAPAIQPMPDHLRRRIEADSGLWMRQAFPRPIPMPARSSISPATGAAAPVAGRISLGPWLIAAASLIVAATVWVLNMPSAIGTQPARVQLDAFLDEAPQDLIEAEWQVLEDPSVTPQTTSGKVLWSDAAQTGYMVFDGLAVNDPSQQQYQLWIFDATGDERYPIDGGVFDIEASGEVVVKIDPKIEVGKAAMFAITIEKPGGVVVSDRSRLPLLAQPAAGDA